MIRRARDLWDLVRQQHIDPSELAEAIEAQALRPPLDYRTRLLIRDGVNALEEAWGVRSLEDWLHGSQAHAELEAICEETFERPGFPSLRSRLMENADIDGIHEYLRTLGKRVHHKVRIHVGGSMALILTGHLSRATEDIDVVDEVPPELRNEHDLLDQLEKRFGLRLAHSPSHYLPSGWEARTHSIGDFGGIQISLVDAHDMFLSKLFSRREKDLDDLRVLKPQLERANLLQRLKSSSGPLCSDPKLRQYAENNWYILFGEPLPV